MDFWLIQQHLSQPFRIHWLNLALQITAIFEYCAPSNRIVVFYENTKLVLTALRHKETGKYELYEQVCKWAERFDVPAVGLMETSETSLADVIDRVWKMDDAEGSVICFEDGTLTKLKGEWYIQLHKLLSYFEYEKDIAWLVLSSKEDDLMGILDKDKKQRLLEYRDGLRASMMVIAKELEHWRERVKTEKLDRKTFATIQDGPSHVVKHTIFRHWDDLDAIKIMPNLIEVALHNTGRRLKWDAFKKENNINLQWTSEIID